MDNKYRLMKVTKQKKIFFNTEKQVETGVFNKCTVLQVYKQKRNDWL